MSLRFSTTGVAVYGTGTVAVDGTTPAALTGTVGPAAWENTGILVYQDGGTGSGPWTLKRLTLPATIANIDSSPASQIVGGGSRWAAFEPLTGVRTDISVGPFSNGMLGDMSDDGDLAFITSATGILSGLAVVDTTGATIFDDPTIVLHNPQICIRDGWLSYFDATGWHLIDSATGNPAPWYPRTDGVTALVPVTHQGTLYVLERSNVLSLRPANIAQGWVLSTDPNLYSLDAVSVSGLVRAGICNVPSETPASLVVFDCTITKAKTISVSTGTIVAGAIVYGAAATIQPQTFTVGPLEGNTLTPDIQMPVTSDVFLKTEKGNKASKPWIEYWNKLNRNAVAASAVLQNLPTPNLTTGIAFDHVASSGQPTLVAQLGMTTLNLEGTAGTVVVTLNPALNSATIAAICYVPVSTGAEPLVIVSNGAGSVLLTPYTP